MTALRRLRGLLLGCLLVPLAGQADENDWLYFPMYQNDTAHAVHYKALKPRPDGLLDAASRYPMHSRDKEWPPGVYEQAWYEYYPRLIDCETGLLVDLSHQLLTRDGRVLFTRPLGRADWVQRMLNDRGDRHWPSGSEIFLACAAAGDTGLKASRKRPVASRVPVIGFTRVTSLLGKDTEAVSAKRYFQPDFSALAAAKSPTAERLFESLRAQYEQWVAGFTPRWAPAGPASRGAKPAAVPQRPPIDLQALAGLQGHRPSIRRLEAPAPGELRVQLEARPAYGSALSEMEPPEAYRSWIEARIDCRSRLAVGTHWLWTDRQGRLLGRQAAPFKEALASLQQELERSGGGQGSRPAWDQWPADAGYGVDAVQLICQAAAAHCLDVAPVDALPALQFSEADFPDTLETPEAILRHAHELWLRDRQQRVPSCRFSALADKPTP